MPESLRLRGSLWMTIDGKSFGGPGRIELLARIAACGSISQAARAMKMSYKAAWDAIELMGRLAGKPLVERTIGGKGGGGSRLTPRGEQLVANFRSVEHEHRRFVDALTLQSGRNGMAAPPSAEITNSGLQYIEPLARPGIVEKYLPANWRPVVPLPTHIRMTLESNGAIERSIGFDADNQPYFTRCLRHAAQGVAPAPQTDPDQTLCQEMHA